MMKATLLRRIAYTIKDTAKEIKALREMKSNLVGDTRRFFGVFACLNIDPKSNQIIAEKKSVTPINISIPSCREIYKSMLLINSLENLKSIIIIQNRFSIND